MGRNSLATLTAVLILATTRQGGAAGDAEAGAQVFQTCAACHTLEQGVHRTGPSLAGVFGRKAGAAEGFHRYSEALRSADLVWREDTLNGFLANPQAFLPGNRMTFRGIDDAQARRPDRLPPSRDRSGGPGGAGRHDGGAATDGFTAGGRAE
jgi:cytochrome c